MPAKPLLQLIRDMNTFSEQDIHRALHTPESSPHKPLYVVGVVVGIVPAFVVPAILDTHINVREIDLTATTATATVDDGGILSVTDTGIHMHLSLTTYQTRSAAFARLLNTWRTSNRFKCLLGWRNEIYDVYDTNGVAVMGMERSGAGLFGVRSFGCHLNGIVLPDPSLNPTTTSIHGVDPKSIRLWIAKRSPTKQTNPSMLDTLSGGGLPTLINPLDNMIKESWEEAGIPHDLCCDGIRSSGVTSVWIYDTLRGIIPDTQYNFDLVLPSSFTPVSHDGEVSEFHLWDLDTVYVKLCDGLFTTEASVVLCDFLLRVGYVTCESVVGYEQLGRAVRRDMVCGGPNFYKK